MHESIVGTTRTWLIRPTMSVIWGEADPLGSISYSWTGASLFRGLSFLLIPHDDQAILRQYQQSLSFWRAPSADAVRFRSILWTAGALFFLPSSLSHPPNI